MFLLNIKLKTNTINDMNVFTIQNVSIKSSLSLSSVKVLADFTIQNVSIKLIYFLVFCFFIFLLQYKMFLLNIHHLISHRLFKCFYNTKCFY